MSQLEVRRLCKKYCLGGGKVKNALYDIEFSIEKGESTAIIGKNGSGKSTLLKLLCGVTAPTDGEIFVNGRIAALLELGAGFQPEYTGIENIYLNGMINSIPKKTTDERLRQILEFAGIGDYAYCPVRTYSNGMFVRLAFAAAVFNDPEILIIDEALAIGDFMFQSKCFNKINELKRSGTTIIYVTHDIDAARRLCDRCLWLDDGRLRLDGEISAVTSAYMESAVNGSGSLTTDGMLNRYGSNIGSVISLDCPSVWELGQPITVSIGLSIPFGADLKNTSAALSIKNKEGLDILVLRSNILENRRNTAAVKFSFKSPLCKGRYFLSAALENTSVHPIGYYDYCDGIKCIEAVDSSGSFGLINIPAEVTFIEKE